MASLKLAKWWGWTFLNIPVFLYWFCTGSQRAYKLHNFLYKKMEEAEREYKNV